MLLPAAAAAAAPIAAEAIATATSSQVLLAGRWCRLLPCAQCTLSSPGAPLPCHPASKPAHPEPKPRPAVSDKKPLLLQRCSSRVLFQSQETQLRHLRSSLRPLSLLSSRLLLPPLYLPPLLCSLRSSLSPFLLLGARHSTLKKLQPTIYAISSTLKTPTQTLLFSPPAQSPPAEGTRQGRELTPISASERPGQSGAPAGRAPAARSPAAPGRDRSDGAAFPAVRQGRLGFRAGSAAARGAARREPGGFRALAAPPRPHAGRPFLARRPGAAFRPLRAAQRGLRPAQTQSARLLGKERRAARRPEPDALAPAGAPGGALPGPRPQPPLPPGSRRLRRRPRRTLAGLAARLAPAAPAAASEAAAAPQRSPPRPGPPRARHSAAATAPSPARAASAPPPAVRAAVALVDRLLLDKRLPF